MEMKFAGTPSFELICFQSIDSLRDCDNIRSPYFIFPCDAFIEGSTKALIALLLAMEKKKMYGLARMIARKYSEPRYVALLPQREENDELGQIRPTGFHVIFLPYLDDIRDIRVDNHEIPTVDKEAVNLAMTMIEKLELADVPRFENPELQKHYASIQALALNEEELEYDEAHDSTLPDAAGFAQEDVQDAIERFKEAFGAMSDTAETKRKSKSASRMKEKPIKRAKRIDSIDTQSDLSPSQMFDLGKWREMVEKNTTGRQTVKELQAFLRFHSQPTSGRKAELVDRIEIFVTSESKDRFEEN
ncbi:hypothetical protein ABG067_000817 [Albugo candida]